MGVIVTARSGYDLGYAWKKPRSGWRQARRTSPGGVLHRSCARRRAARTVVGGQARNARFQMDGGRHDAVYKQIQPGTGKRLGRCVRELRAFRGSSRAVSRRQAHATAERRLELEREAAQATRQPAAYTDMTVSFSKSISVVNASIRRTLGGPGSPATTRPRRGGTAARNGSRKGCATPTGQGGSIRSGRRDYPHQLLRRTRGARPGPQPCGFLPDRPSGILLAGAPHVPWAVACSRKAVKAVLASDKADRVDDVLVAKAGRQVGGLARRPADGSQVASARLAWRLAGPGR